MRGAPAGSGQRTRQVSAEHEGFLRHRNFLWLKRALGVSALALLVYALVDVEPRHNGGSWLGYGLGTLGTGLILWLTALGVRKRRMTPGAWSLKAWTSAHVYLGLSLIVIATLHTGFQLGWNVHTLAYALMMLVIASGVFGIVVYARVPPELGRNREEMTGTQMLESLAATDRQLRAAAQPLERRQADLVLAALSEDPMSAGLLARLGRPRREGPTRDAIDALVSARADAGLAQVQHLLHQRATQIDRIRRQLRLKAALEVWLYVHVPATFALIAALTAHIVSVFFYW